MLGWEAADDSVRVATDRGEYRARRLVLCAGAWLGALAPALGPRLRVERQVMQWHEPRVDSAMLDADHLPVTLIEHDGGHMFYVIPDLGDGLKAAIHHDGPAVDPDHAAAPVTDAESAAVTALVERFVPDAAGPIVDRATCLYTNTPDGHFVVDTHPGAPAVLVVSACSGHGFKFAAAIGEAVADLTVGGATTADLSPFGLARFARAAGAS